MALLLARTPSLSKPSALPRVRSNVSSSQPAIWRSVHRRTSVFRCCAVSVEDGGFEDARDGGLVAASGGSPSRVTNSKACSENRAAQAPAMGNAPGSPLKEGEASVAEEPWMLRAESTIERTIFDFRFLTLMAVCGSLVGSLLCFLKGCGFVCESFIAYYTLCLNGKDTGKVILRLVEAVDVYLVGTVMLIFGMGLYGLFISNEPKEGQNDRALKNTTLFGMFPLKTRPRWMRITTLDTLKTKLGHVIVMILLVKLFERSKTVHITSSTDLLYYSFSIFLSSAALYVLQRLHAPS